MNRSERALRTSHSLPSCRSRGRGSCRERAVRRWCCGPSTGRRRRRCSTEPCRVPPADVLASRCPVRVRGRAGGRVGDLEPCEGGIADRYGDVESVGFVRVDHGGERIRELLGTIDEAVCSHGVPAGEAEPVAAARSECDGQRPSSSPVFVWANSLRAPCRSVRVLRHVGLSGLPFPPVAPCPETSNWVRQLAGRGRTASLRVPRTRSGHATCTYSWTRQPSRSRRSGRMAVPDRCSRPSRAGMFPGGAGVSQRSAGRPRRRFR